jgi:hypothetical protein
MVRLAGLNGETSTGNSTKNGVRDSQSPDGPGWPAPKDSRVSARAKTDASGHSLPLGVRFDIGRVASPATMSPIVPPPEGGMAPGDLAKALRRAQKREQRIEAALREGRREEIQRLAKALRRLRHVKDQPR